MAVRLPIQNSSGNVVIAIAGGGSGGSTGYPIAKISLEKCKWQKHLNQLTTPWISNFPKEITVHNPKTDTYRLYFHLRDTDPRFDQDQWDGEQMMYKTSDPTNNAEYLVLYRDS